MLKIKLCKIEVFVIGSPHPKMLKTNLREKNVIFVDFHKLDDTFLRSFDHTPLQKLSLTVLLIPVILYVEDYI